MDNIKSPRVAAQTVIHEVTHQRFDIGKCQWAEAVCMAKEKMHITGRNTLTVEEKRYIIKLAKEAYPEYNWKKGGYKGGEHITCLNCHKGEYTCANPQYLKKADFFRCDNCGDFLHVLSSDVIVE